MRKIIAVLLTASMIWGLTACGDGEGVGEEPEDRGAKPKQSLYVVMITDEGGLNEGSLNEQVWTGIQRAEEEFGIMTNCLEPETAADYDKKISMALESEADLIVCNGKGMTEAVGGASEANPDQKFIVTDGVVEADNVLSLTFEGQEEPFSGADQVVYRVVEELAVKGAFEGGVVPVERSE